MNKTMDTIQEGADLFFELHCNTSLMPLKHIVTFIAHVN
jgi:hypothetical protein